MPADSDYNVQKMFVASRRLKGCFMSRLLIRSKVSPFENHNVEETLKRSLLGNNSGNLLFAYSATRLLDTGENDLSFIADYKITNGKVSAEWINENFDHLVLPMANSFRKAYAVHLKSWAAMIRKLTIPCTVIGIGVQFANGEKLEDPHPYDDDVKAFVSAVLDHSPAIAVRGEITAAYLNHLGFRDVEVTGCPSFALAGPEFPIKDLPKIDRNTPGTFTGSVKSPESFQQFMRRSFERMPNAYFVPQFNDDLALMYYGVPVTRKLAKKNGYPRTIDDPVFTEDRARFFINIKSMLEFNRAMGFNIGSRIHGCISNIVCGVPSVLFSQDQRVGELASYHHLPLFSFNDIGRFSTVDSFYKKIDLAYMRQGHRERFERLIGYLDANELPHVWKNGTPSVFPADEKLKNGQFHEPVRACCAELEGDALRERIERGKELYGN